MLSEGAKLKKSLERAVRGADNAQIEINSLVMYMDYHLLALSAANKCEDEGLIDFHTAKLEQIRTRLMRLEYFNLGESSISEQESGVG